MGQRHTPQGASAPRSGTQTRLVAFGDSRAEIVSSEPFTACFLGGVKLTYSCRPRLQSSCLRMSGRSRRRGGMSECEGALCWHLS